MVYKKTHDIVSEVKYLGRICRFMVKHFALYDAFGNIIKLPYID
jgi:hypothetical protein